MRRLVALVCWAVVALSAAACRQAPPATTGVPAPATAVTVRSEDLELTMRISSPVLGAGDPLIITFLLRNVGGADRVVRSVTPALFDFAVYDVGGRAVVRPSMPAKPTLARPAIRVLRPGQAAVASIAWDSTSALAPGAYFLQGYAVWTAPGAPLLTTPKLGIEIRTK